MSRLSEVVDFQPGDLTITVGAGMRLSTLARVVEEAGLWLPLLGQANPVSHDRFLSVERAGSRDLRVILDNVGVLASFYSEQTLPIQVFREGQHRQAKRDRHD